MADIGCVHWIAGGGLELRARTNGRLLGVRVERAANEHIRANPATWPQSRPIHAVGKEVVPGTDRAEALDVPGTEQWDIIIDSHCGEPPGTWEDRTRQAEAGLLGAFGIDDTISVGQMPRALRAPKT